MVQVVKQFPIKVWRVNSKMTQQDVADKLGVNIKSIIEWEKEEKELKGLHLYALVKLFETEVDYIKAKKI
ncbi:helix-turn-helix domain-containing protein [Staphylococcus coagulans]|uniref:helix-turn-helix domain-containing protein n=1 Tax=Staphylococcus coagulans TaxID=74706 RepID=UPI003364C7FB